MNLPDKANNKPKNTRASGKKGHTGRATNHELKNESKTDQAKADLKQADKKYLRTSSKARSPPEAAPEPGRALVIPCVQQASITRTGPPTSGGEPRPSVIVPSAADGVPGHTEQH